MKLFTDEITWSDIYDAERAAGVTAERRDRVDGRHKTSTFDIILSGESGRRTNQRWGMRDEGVEAATWDQWGIFIAHLYALDSDAVWGSLKVPQYANEEDFHNKTGFRFDADLAEDSPDEVVVSRDSADYKITAHRWTPDFASPEHRPFSGIWAGRCKGHSTKKNKRAECHAVMTR